jgi:hypothetical protein
VPTTTIGYEPPVIDRKSLGWKAISYAAGALAGLITGRILDAAWTGVRHSSPPPTADRRSSWIEALSWAVATGVGIGITRLVAVRTAATVWEAATGEVPPEPALMAETAAG